MTTQQLSLLLLAALLLLLGTAVAQQPQWRRRRVGIRALAPSVRKTGVAQCPPPGFDSVPDLDVDK